MGSGSFEGRGAWNSRGLGAVRNYFGARGRSAAKDDAAVQIWSWGKTGFGATVDVVGGARRRRGDFAICDREQCRKGPDQYSVAPAAAKRGIHEGPCEGHAPASTFPCSCVCAAARTGRNGRRAAVVQPARPATSD